MRAWEYAAESRAVYPTSRFSTVAGRAGLFCTLAGIVLVSLFISGCPLYDPEAFNSAKSAPEDVLSATPQITLAWNPPTTGSVANYIVSYRNHGTTNWIPLATVPASPTPSFTVLRSTIGTGTFDFAVSSEDSNGVTSLLHTSLDATAEPSNGWFLSWGQ